MRLPTLRPILLLAMTVLIAGCHSSVTVVNRDLENAKAAWLARKPASYDLTIEPRCFCGFETTGPVVVAVRNGVVQSRTYVQTGGSVSARSASLYPTVDELYTIIENAVSNMADRLEVQYQTTWYYPAMVAIDPHFNVADDEMFFTVTAFVVR
jgi:hypothetical protein